jgi:dipeptidyl aminopeptidase/acylaminoacyl peptidase
MIRIRKALCAMIFFCSAICCAAQGQARRFSVDDFIQYRDIAPFQRGDIAADGSAVAYTLMMGRSIESGDRYTPSGVRQSLAGAAVFVQDLKSKASIQISAKGATAFAPRWSPDSRHLAFFTDEAGTLQIAIWDRGTGKTRLVAGIQVRQDLLGDAPEWSRNNTVFAKAYVPGQDRMSLDAESSTDAGSNSKVVSVQIHLPANKNVPAPVTDMAGLLKEMQGESDIVMVDGDRAQARRTCRGSGVLSYEPSPDGKHVSVVGRLRLRQAGLYDSQADLYVVTIGAGMQTLDNLKAVASEVHVPIDNEFGAWSPDSRRFAFVESYVDQSNVDTGSGELKIVDVEKMQVRTAIPDFELPDTSKWLASLRPSLNGTAPPKKAKFTTSDMPIWGADGHSVVVLGKGDLWVVDVDQQTSRNLTGDTDQVFGELAPSGETVDDTVVAATDKELVRISISNGMHEAVPIANLTFTRYQLNFVFQPASAKGQQSHLLFFGAGRMSPMDLWLSTIGPGADTSLTRITTMNPQMEGIEWSERKLLKWMTLDGTPTEGILMLPKQHSSGEKLPLIAWVYGGALGQARQIEEFGLLSQELLVAKGYAVLVPDIPMPGIGAPVKQIADGVLPALDAAIATGTIDPEKMGVIGQSYGGYTVNALICQTNRFKAAVSVDGISDLLHVYLGKSVYGTAWAEGQGRMGGTLWQYPDRYIANSPLYHYDRVDTPLLLVHGERDLVVPSEESERMYRALVRLDKTVELAMYPDSDHSYFYWREPQLRDFLNRVIGWFDRYLKQP